MSGSMPFDVYYNAPKPEAPFCVSGPDCQIVTLMLNPGQKLTSEPGAMMYMSPGVKTSVECGSCSRVLTGESCCKTIFQNDTSNQGYIALTPHFPAKVIPLNLSEYGGKVIAKKGMYMASVGDVSVTANCDCTCCASMFGGLGSIRQAMTGTGTVFLAAGGTVLTKVLKEGEQIVVDSESVVGFQDSVKLGIRLAGGLCGCCTCCFGGEGVFNTTLTGPGLVVVQSMAFEKWMRAVAPAANTPEDAAPPTGE